MDDIGGRPGDEFALARTFDAPRELVFKAWTEPARLAEWWGPKGFKLVTCEIEAQPGGVFHYGLRSAEGREMWGRWLLREVVVPERLVFIASFADSDANPVRHPLSPKWPLEVLTTLTFSERDGQTALALTATPLHATDIERAIFVQAQDAMRQGWTGTLDQLADYLAHVQASAPAPAAADHEIVTVSFLDAPRGLVFKAWTDPQQLARWWGPEGFTSTIDELDLRPGGLWRFTMHGPDGTDYPNRNVFRDISPPERLVFDHGWERAGEPALFAVTVTFAPQGGGTLLTMRMSFASAAERDRVASEFGAVEGARQTMDRLERHLAETLGKA